MRAFNRSAFVLFLAPLVVLEAHAAEIFDFSPIPKERIEMERGQFLEAFNAWNMETLNNLQLKASSNLNVYFTGQSFLNLVNMGPAGAPYLVEKMEKERFQNLFLESALGMAMGGSWQQIANIAVAQMPGLPAQEGKATEAAAWWREAALNCKNAWKARRAAFDERLKQGRPSEMKLRNLREEKQWADLLSMGLYGLPSLITRISAQAHDEYDILLLNLWTAPLEVETLDLTQYVGGKETHVPYPKRTFRCDRIVVDTEHWLRWWNENKSAYWWLLSTE